MRKISLLLFLSLVLACGGNSSKNPNSGNVLENLTFTIDTVLVDPKDEIFDLGFGVHNSALSLDTKTFYFFDMRKTVIYEIDLDRLEMVAVYPFSKEGPNSIGFNPPKINSLQNDRFLITSPGINVGIFTKNGQKEKSLKFNFREIEGLGVQEEGLITSRVTLSHDEEQMFALTRLSATQTEVRLLVIDPNSKTGKSIELPSMHQAVKFTLLLQQPKRVSSTGENIWLNTLHEKLFITSSVTSDTYVYDYAKDSLILVEFNHKLVPRKKTGDFESNLFTDEKAFEDAAEKQINQVAFKELIWDDQRKQFFRFAYKRIKDSEGNWYRSADVYLFVYDDELALLGEKYLPEFSNVPEFTFFKDGKLWSYVNVNDELGFAVMDFKF
ncbi:protein of unknown function [Algoriphagus ornithinivorans]|uniref:TolB-like 6-blade propeller-like n=1 Tax=Algoriphagus ornithinivorans TaxID=226506 RepID=A0A1I5G4A0_9BACT|nr:DUF4221 family protein [Algoriphagus ornithinivorans]SFO30802.1 protein of unknown function [Algoriphagus ornithinivorans]